MFCNKAVTFPLCNISFSFLTCSQELIKNKFINPNYTCWRQSLCFVLFISLFFHNTFRWSSYFPIFLVLPSLVHKDWYPGEENVSLYASSLFSILVRRFTTEFFKGERLSTPGPIGQQSFPNHHQPHLRMNNSSPGGSVQIQPFKLIYFNCVTF